jgi:hypothetical protein
LILVLGLIPPAPAGGITGLGTGAGLGAGAGGFGGTGGVAGVSADAFTWLNVWFTRSRIPCGWQ